MNRRFADPRTMFIPEISPARAHARPGFDDFC